MAEASRAIRKKLKYGDSRMQRRAVALLRGMSIRGSEAWKRGWADTYMVGLLQEMRDDVSSISFFSLIFFLYSSTVSFPFFSSSLLSSLSRKGWGRGGVLLETQMDETTHVYLSNIFPYYPRLVVRSSDQPLLDPKVKRKLLDALDLWSKMYAVSKKATTMSFCFVSEIRITRN